MKAPKQLERQSTGKAGFGRNGPRAVLAGACEPGRNIYGDAPMARTCPPVSGLDGGVAQEAAADTIWCGAARGVISTRSGQSGVGGDMIECVRQKTPSDAPLAQLDRASVYGTEG